MANVYTVVLGKAKYKKTKRGVNATASIMLGNAVACILYDTAEEIVAKVEFFDQATKAQFLLDAIEAGHKQQSDSFTISEYARAILNDAEKAYLAAAEPN